MGEIKIFLNLISDAIFTDVVLFRPSAHEYEFS